MRKFRFVDFVIHSEVFRICRGKNLSSPFNTSPLLSPSIPFSKMLIGSRRKAKRNKHFPKFRETRLLIELQMLVEGGASRENFNRNSVIRPFTRPLLVWGCFIRERDFPSAGSAGKYIVHQLRRRILSNFQVRRAGFAEMANVTWFRVRKYIENMEYSFPVRCTGLELIGPKHGCAARALGKRATVAVHADRYGVLMRYTLRPAYQSCLTHCYVLVTRLLC